MEVRYTLEPPGGGPHGFAGFVDVDELSEAAIVAALAVEYPGTQRGVLELTYVEAKR